MPEEKEGNVLYTTNDSAQLHTDAFFKKIS